MKYRGQCLCGEVKYEVERLTPSMGHCHCSMCRKFHGAAFATFGEAASEHFHWTKGESCLKSYTAANKTIRRFCKHCGSSMTFEPSDSDGSLVEFTLGTLDTPIAQQPDAHIFVDNKASWYPIEDALPQYSAGRQSKQIK